MLTEEQKKEYVKYSAKEMAKFISDYYCDWQSEDSKSNKLCAVVLEFWRENKYLKKNKL